MAAKKKSKKKFVPFGKGGKPGMDEEKLSKLDAKAKKTGDKKLSAKVKTARSFMKK